MRACAEGWTLKNLSEVVELKRGFDLPTRERRGGPYPVLSAGVTAGWHDSGPIKGPGMVVGRATNLGVPTWSDGDFWPLNTTLYVADFKGNCPRFVFHLFENMDLSGFDSGSVQPMLNRNYIAKLQVVIPPVIEQEAIAEVLGALDDKIAANRRLVDQLRVLAQAKFRSVLSENPVKVALGAVSEFHNRRRAPLSAIEREGRVGEVPYYGATGVFDYVDEALFDEILVLVGEDGSVVTDEGYPVTQYIWGPAWVNNHAHVLTGSSISTEILLLAVERVNVEPLVTGAVQPKLNMGNLKNLELLVPGPDGCANLDCQVQPIFEMLRWIHEESRTLETIRDTLLPRLMSGELRVRDAEKVVSNAV
ncbi:restriction endonuclease subunit S [Rhodococcus rhodochrous]|uniref:restriction endonuclease subunit S n=1 Tax=Rhodococcus rhodochrous TaxID=1829 RepID=UPI001E5CB93F|nr:restriction endonuclease subunit S [Rhodococcus rhodochrous]MCD2097528.1 restriction endonuclease subunit S [Rhodococcus rhodochrous]MCD2122750.1 restriction endonuclease subunit S [Rhodococcus rhodochrous]MCQ4133639.1 restriction endonuclease subunit S [Rhodococcus rhodochrous]MDJ0018144.1 restriction endonuclease subunit S [Rhodococcus rhodochrous]